MSRQHTPGPWRARLKSEKTWNVGVYTESGDEVAHIAVKGALTAARRDADARLIAAAPRMLSVIEKYAAAGDSECSAILEVINGRS
jgi:hypothetical protein